MADHNDIGKFGEELAVQYLRKIGYQIQAQNWRFSRTEIDIIAIHQNTLVVAEVKTRTSKDFENPKEAVTKTKQRSIIKAANAYIEQFNVDKECRFDILSVLIIRGKAEIEHIVDAFYPEL